jgi:hypothetical protein
MDHLKEQEHTVRAVAHQCQKNSHVINDHLPLHLRLAIIFFAALLAPQAHADEQIGRLFFTPTERTQLDQQQKQQSVKAQMSASGEDERSSITVNGLIKRSDGSRIVWLNGKAQKMSAGGDPNQVPVTLPGQNKTVQVKVGQRVMIDNPAPTEAIKPAPNEDDD